MQKLPEFPVISCIVYVELMNQSKLGDCRFRLSYSRLAWLMGSVTAMSTLSPHVAWLLDEPTVFP